MSNPENTSVFPNITLYAGAQKKQFSLDDYDLSPLMPKKENRWDKLSEVMTGYYKSTSGLLRRSKLENTPRQTVPDPYDLSSIYAPGSRASDRLFKQIDQSINNTIDTLHAKGSSMGRPNHWYNVPIDWFFELGPNPHIYTGKDPITQDLMKDEGMQQARQKWEKEGKETPYSYEYKFGVNDYKRELYPFDGTANVLGSYKVDIDNTSDGKYHFNVKNVSGWESGTRSPIPIPNEQKKFHPSWETLYQERNLSYLNLIRAKSILDDKKRKDSGPGGNFEQNYDWYE